MSEEVVDIIADNTKWWILLTVIVGTFLGRMDQTIVGLAVPKIMQDFSITVAQAGWISTAYIIANAICVPVWGKLGDLLGRKKIYILGFSIFIGGSILCGLAWNFGSLISFRIIQAVAVSADYPTAMAILAITFRESKERAQAMGIWSASFAAAIVFGPLIGGPLIDNFGWPSVFFINLPIGILGLIMASTFIHESRSGEQSLNFDWWGAVYLGASLASLVLVLDKGADWGWLSFNSFISYFFILLFGIIFYFNEKKHPEPIIDLKFFKNQIFTNALINNFIVFMGFIGAIFVIPTFAQIYLGYDATKTGYLFIPMAFIMIMSAPLGASLTGKVQPRWVIMASTAIAAVGLYQFTRLDPKSGAWDIIYPMVIVAFGMGFGMAQRTNIISAVVPKREIGSASSVLALVRNIAGAFGIAVFNTILTNTTKTSALNLSRFSFININNPAVYQKFIALINMRAQILGFRKIFLVSTIVVLVGTAAAYWIRIPKGQQMDNIMIE